MPTAIRKKLAAWVQVADEQKIKAIYTMVADDIRAAENDWDADFEKTLNRRSKEVADGSAKTYTWDETKAAAIGKAKAKK